jgi:hypothetical protein
VLTKNIATYQYLIPFLYRTLLQEKTTVTILIYISICNLQTENAMLIIIVNNIFKLYYYNMIDSNLCSKKLTKSQIIPIIYY